MSDPNYHSIDTDTAIGGQVWRSGIGLMRPMAVVVAIAGIGVVLYFLFSGGEREPTVDTTPREEFRPVQAPRNEGFNPPAPPPLPTVQVPEAPPPPQPPLPEPVVPAPVQIAPPVDVDCSRGNNPDNPRCIELARKAKLLERVRSSAVVFDQSEQRNGSASASSDASGAGLVGANGSSGAPSGGNPDAGGATDGDRAFLKAMGGQGVEVSTATENRRIDAWIPQGTMIRGTLETAVNSDLAGMVKAIVREDVYSFDGRRILIPAGSSLIGDYKSGVERGQERLFIVWTRMIRGDGVSVQLGSYGTDRLGRSGMTGVVDRKYWERFGPPALMTIIGGVTQYIAQLGQKQDRSITIVNTDGTVTSIPQDNGTTSQDRAREIAAETIASGIQQLATEAFQDTKNIKPTIHIAQGSDITVFVTRDLDFSDLYPDPVREAFERLRRKKLGK
ncbi:type IV secretion system protein VirB10 [Rhizobium sp. VS19-DR104.2]|uniref:type IV secretion system protein VirB10 n=1 Tax=unclassified Rhizobium TaxID=2613769 RepID=UPI001CC404A2|nr:MULTISPECIES: type IV secretion system protein VirB10 [unclassified Rhizobium]MBZ5763118.1 type IV secretion system protein VirB10 [Rhizobium sp. VS19-DR96]MBZ5769035.1 type IV secretion system protein VirB10 [Rhizobium sp. VS19-DR129.2]MBZ5776613.1 type IV secretion system protein VirB10 [Rhizobium sp. VS19-DRK62.2]MBZ5787725.1 type IV secretion system protein VirB10 [Rhizobium sp. VS19-DR121]MBZ5805111.1 type IV secretion system protein VirB10 [Rhizobium sp. VS19-DR181]